MKKFIFITDEYKALCMENDEMVYFFKDGDINVNLSNPAYIEIMSREEWNLNAVSDEMPKCKFDATVRSKITKTFTIDEWMDKLDLEWLRKYGFTYRQQTQMAQTKSEIKR